MSVSWEERKRENRWNHFFTDKFAGDREKEEEKLIDVKLQMHATAWQPELWL